MKHATALVVLLVALLMVTGCSGLNSSNHPYTAQGNSSGHHKAKTKAQKKAFNHLTVSQQQAIGAAQNYLSVQGYSKAGLISQLTSKYADQYKLKDAVFAVNHIKVNWFAQAVRSAKNYLTITHYSCQGLIGQLSSRYADKYTLAQARYAGKKVGLC